MSDDKSKKQLIEEVKAVKEKTTDKNLQQVIADKAAQMQKPVLK